MFDDVLKELRELERGIEFQVPLEADQDGFLDKECPSESCQFQFKVNAEDWTSLFQDEAVYCPLCRHSAPADSWFTTEQVEHAKSEALEHVAGRIGEALRKGARGFNQRQPRGGFIQISMEVRGVRSRRAVIPAPPTEPLELRITCEECGSRFAVVGSAFFCPCCGHNSAERTFDDGLRKIRAKLEAVPLIKEHYSEQRDEGELLVRSLIGTALSDCVVAIQRLAEQIYSRIAGQPEPPQNVFQRVDDGSELWRTARGKGYDDWLAEDELEDLRLLFQRRHLLQHTEGIVDQKYLDRTGDTKYQLGQRIVVREADVLRLLGLVESLAAGMRAAAG